MSTSCLATVFWRHFLSNPQTKRHTCLADIPIDWSEKIRPLKLIVILNLLQSVI